MKKKEFMRWFVLALFCLLLGQAAIAPVSQAAEISVIINGNQLTTDVAPYIQDPCSRPWAPRSAGTAPIRL